MALGPAASKGLRQSSGTLSDTQIGGLRRVGGLGCGAVIIETIMSPVSGMLSEPSLPPASKLSVGMPAKARMEKHDMIAVQVSRVSAMGRRMLRALEHSEMPLGALIAALSSLARFAR